MEEFLSDWVSDDRRWKRLKNYHNLSLETEKELRKTITKKTYTLYRGVYLTPKYGSSLLYQLGLSEPKLGTYNLPLEDLTSWTLSSEEAREFADVNGYTGLIFKVQVSSSFVLADLSDFNTWEKEVILKPGVYRVKIMDILNEELFYKEATID